jgi:hypothetical protein
MSLAYRILYAVGFTPWEEMAESPIAGQIADLFAREEEAHEPPYGRALDLGFPRGNAADDGLDPRAPRAAAEGCEPRGHPSRLP